MEGFNPYNQSADKDKELEGIIRPQALTDFTGQEKIKSQGLHQGCQDEGGIP